MKYCKTVPFLGGLSLLLVCGGCGHGKSGRSDTDSTALSVVENEGATSPDCVFKELSGNVKSVALEFYTLDSPAEISVDSVSFDKNGRLEGMTSFFISGGDKTCVADFRFDYTSAGETLPASSRIPGNDFEARISRDGLGRIIEFVCEMPGDPERGGEGTYREEYTWDASGKVGEYVLIGWEWAAHTGYTYGDDGLRIKAVTVNSDIGFESTDTQTYVYKTFDDRGNWTEREVKVVSEQDDEGVKSRNTSVRIERRRIHYR